MSKLPKDLKFEDALKRLDAIVEEMESGTIGIEQAADRYEEAMNLVTRCQSILEQTEMRIRKIQARTGGQPVEEPFEEEGGGPVEND